MVALSAIFIVALAVAHLAAAYLRFIHMTPRSRWLSFAGGVSVAFVFLELLPHLHQAHAELGQVVRNRDQGLYLVYLLAMVGLVAFYGMEVAVRASRRRRGESDWKRSPGMFILHVGAFAIYNMVIGAMLLSQVEYGFRRQTLFFAALALHMMVNDFALRERHEEEYRRYGRWMLAAAVMVGWAAHLLLEIPEAVLSAAIALLAGAIMLNVLKEELPAEREGRFGSFVAGAVVFAVLLLVASA